MISSALVNSVFLLQYIFSSEKKILKRRAGVEPAQIRSAGERSAVVPPPHEKMISKIYLKIVLRKVSNSEFSQSTSFKKEPHK